MSLLLETLLDAQRRRECEANDAADREEDMRHSTCSTARAMAERIASEPIPADSDYELTVLQPGQPEVHLHQRFPSQLDAHLYVIEKYGPGAVWMARDGGAAGAMQ